MNASLSQDEIRRLEWIKQAGILDSASDPDFDDVTALAARLCGVPIAAISIIDQEREWFKSIVGLDIRETPRAQSFSAHAILQNAPLVVIDATQDARFANNPLVNDQTNIRFYAGVPLITTDGFALGSLCVLDRTPRELTQDQQDALVMLARQVAGRIELQRRIALQEARMADYQQDQAKQRENEARLRLTMESGRFGTWGFSLVPEAHQEVSDQTKFLFGLPLNSPFSQDDFFEAVYIEDRPRVRDSTLHSLEDHEIAEVEFRVFWPDGSMHWLSGHICPVFNEAGEATEIIGVTQEITERKAREAEQELALRDAQGRADRDSLTGLWNHRSFHRRLEEETARARRTGTTLAVIMLDLNDFKFFNDAYGHLQGDVVLRQVADRLVEICRSYDVIARYGGDEFGLLLPEVGVSSLSDVETRLKSGIDGVSYRPLGYESPIPITVSLGAALLTSDIEAPVDLLNLADERLRRAKSGGISETEASRIRAEATGLVKDFTMLDALVTAVDNKDRYTRKHSEDVMVYSMMIATELGLDEETLHTVAVSALIHDVGKIGVPDSILRKPGKLTTEEFAAVRQHPAMGAIMVGAVPGLEKTLDAVRHHHERWDGAGYPSGLSGEHCPLIARVMAVADAFSAMTTDRPYRKGMDQLVAQEILMAGAGTQWDPKCVTALQQSIARRKISPASEQEQLCK
jgi:diguanylate cyclase (GGDEF)-like protein/PAS domain S-box-containing protein